MFKQTTRWICIDLQIAKCDHLEFPNRGGGNDEGINRIAGVADNWIRRCKH
jgi:hypothetical protein